MVDMVVMVSVQVRNTLLANRVLVTCNASNVQWLRALSCPPHLTIPFYLGYAV